MTFRETALVGVWIVEPEPREDARGFFARTWCRWRFEARGLDPALPRCRISVTCRRGTVHSLHFQPAPHAEAKPVRCTRGAIHDVALDVRRAWPTFGRWAAAELTPDDHRMLNVPAAVAHGSPTLTDDVEVLDQISEFHHPESARRMRWDDAAVGVAWPVADVSVSPRGAGLPRLADL